MRSGNQPNYVARWRVWGAAILNWIGDLVISLGQSLNELAKALTGLQ